jgi:uncharacterized protein (TIGR03083 family)
MIDFPLAPSYYLDALKLESDRLAIAARRTGPDLSVPSCPGWNISKLVLHVGVLHRWVATMVSDGATERLDPGAVERAPNGDERIAWLESGAADLVRVLGEVGVDKTVWTLEGLGRSGFWYRRMAQETLVHRFDAESAGAMESVVDPIFAADGVDEYWTSWIGRKLAQQPVEGLQGVVTLRASDVDATWTISLTQDGVELLSRESPAEVVVTGPSAELLAFLWNRSQLMTADVDGDRRLVDSWRELAQF